jgi:hypothetical protein
MNGKTIWSLTLTLALSIGGVAVASPAPGGKLARTEETRMQRLLDRHPRLARKHDGRAHAREGILRLMKTLEASDAQRGVALESARAAEPIARRTRSEAARIRAEVLAEHGGNREAAREEMRTRVQKLRRSTLAEIAPLAQRVLSTLTPEQRAKLEAAATKRGKTLDEDRLLKITSFLLTRPATLPRLEAKSGR